MLYPFDYKKQFNVIEVKMDTSIDFQYLNLDKVLYKLYNSNANGINLYLLVSLEKDYYIGDNLKKIIADLRKLVNNKEIIWNINGKLERFKVNKLSLFVGDVLNRHMFYYRHCADYFDKHNIDQEDLIPLDVRKQFEERSYIDGKQEGKDWFKDNIDAFNLFSDEKVLTKDYYIGDDITTIFEETENTPKLEYICYEHWLRQPEYRKTEQLFFRMIHDENCSSIDRCYTYEAEAFYNRLDKRGETPKYKDLFIKQSRKYLMDETIPAVVLSSGDVSNNLNIYYHGKTQPHFLIYKGKHFIHNKVGQSYLNAGLQGLSRYEQITIIDNI